jgi:hypothetical protein
MPDEKKDEYVFKITLHVTIKSTSRIASQMALTGLTKNLGHWFGMFNNNVCRIDAKIAGVNAVVKDKGMA